MGRSLDTLTLGESLPMGRSLDTLTLEVNPCPWVYL
jgi:hypothetical protein